MYGVTAIMCTIHPLHKNLHFHRSQIKVFEDAKDIVKSKKQLISGTTGSKSFIYLVKCMPSSKVAFSIVVKVQRETGKIREKRDGLLYEKMIYKLMTEVVNSGVCPFRIRAYDMLEPDNVLITETFSNMESLGTFLKKKNPKRECNYMLTQILYALEVNYRLGIRHNDLHDNNIMVRHCKSTTIVLKYITRNKLTTILSLPDCTFMIMLFDNDRVTKQQAANATVTKNLFRGPLNPDPVLQLFPFFEPSLYTEKLDLFKIMQIIRHNVKTKYMKTLLAKMTLSELKLKKISESFTTKQARENFNHYFLVTRNGKRKEPTTLPSWLEQLNSTEDALLGMTKHGFIQHGLIQPQKDSLVADLSKLYPNIKTFKPLKSHLKA
jgi:hypothetical protein